LKLCLEEEKLFSKPEAVFAKVVDVSKSDSEDTGADDAAAVSDISEALSNESDSDPEREHLPTDINLDTLDVENAGEIWEGE
jgi:hypothetical protein